MRLVRELMQLHMARNVCPPTWKSIFNAFNVKSILHAYERSACPLVAYRIGDEFARVANVDGCLLLVTRQHPYLNTRLQKIADRLGHLRAIV